MTSVSKEIVLAELDRILASSPFASANRSSALLRFLVVETLDGRSERFKEYVLGVEALGRSEKFDPRTDPIARVEVSRLRGKLDQYYGSLTSQTPVRISLPRGTYAPEFTIQSKQVEQKRPFRRTSYWGAWVGAAFVAGALLAFLLTNRVERHETLRVSILPPHNGEVTSLALSPDGQSIAMAVNEVGSSHLFLRPIANSFQPRLLTGTEDASFPFWSPDGQSIGFFARNKLKVVDINGGEPRSVTDTPLGRGGAWTRRGQIIFAPGALGPLLQVSAKGGRVVPFTSLDQAQGEVSHLWPVLLPDGERLAFLTQYRDPALDAIVATRLSNPVRRTPILRADSSIAFSKSTRDELNIMFLRDGALIEQRLTEPDLAISGNPTIIAALLNFDPLDRYALFSASLQRGFAFVPGTPFRFNLQWTSRSGGEAYSVPGNSDYYALKMSPDGSHLLTNQTDSRTGSTGVWLSDLVRGTASPISAGGVDFFPVWSPDGLEVAFAKSDGTAERGMRLTIVPRSGNTSRVVLDVHGPVFPSDWSGDGTLLAYTGYAPRAQVNVISMRGTVKKVWSYTPGDHNAGGGVFKPTTSHEAPKWIAYTSDESGRNEVYVQSLLADRGKVQVSVSGGDRPLWRLDGKELYFVNSREELCVVDVVQDSIGFGPPRALFTLPGSQQGVPPYALDYAAAPDGQRFLTRRVDPGAERSVINLVR